MPVKSQESVSPCEISLDIEVESATVADAVERAYREFSKYVSVPGFRPGKAPMPMVRARVPQENVRERTIELLAEPAYKEAITETKIRPFASPNFELVRLETKAPDYTFEFKAIVPLAPVVELGRYKGLTVEVEPVAITEQDVDERIEQLIQAKTQHKPLDADRPAEPGNFVYGTQTITVDGETIRDAHVRAFALGDKNNLPGLDEALAGIRAGETRQFETDFPPDDPDVEVAGKHAAVTVTASTIIDRIVPAVDDEFVQSVSDAKTVAEFRDSIREALTKSLEEARRVNASMNLIDQVVQNSKIYYPQVVVDNSIRAEHDELLQRLQGAGLTLDQYLEDRGIEPEQYVERLKDEVSQRLNRGLAIAEIGAAEKIEVTDEEFEAELKSRAETERTTVEAIKAYAERRGELGEMRNRLLTQKHLAFLYDNAIIVDKAPPAAEAVSSDLPADEPAGEPVAKKSRKKKTAEEPAAQ